MKTFTNKVVKTLCTAAIVLGFSTSAMANTVTEQDTQRKPAVQAQQVYKFTYNKQSFAGSLAEDIQLAQADILADLKMSRNADIAAAITRAGVELQGYALLASANTSGNSSASWAVDEITTLLPSVKARAYL